MRDGYGCVATILEKFRVELEANRGARVSGLGADDIRDHYVEEIFGVRPLDLRYSDGERYLDVGRAAVAESRARVAAALRGRAQRTFA